MLLQVNEGERAVQQVCMCVRALHSRVCRTQARKLVQEHPQLASSHYVLGKALVAAYTMCVCHCCGLVCVL
jgi:hypothetical protein